jgi:site-specific DNA-methyltransferase (adenine-specific)
VTPQPYYQDDLVTLYHGDCREIIEWRAADVLVTDPPYPNNAGWFGDAVIVARDVIHGLDMAEAIVFWTEMEQPPYTFVPLVAVHVWHRTNVNGRPYEPAYHFAAGGVKRRSDVLRYPAIFDGAGPGCREYLGHPTQKPAVVMRQLIDKTHGSVVADPFAGSGSTLRAAKDTGRRAIGVEVDERYCEIAARRLAQDVLDFGDGAA